MQPGYGDSAPYDEPAHHRGPLPDYLQPGFDPHRLDPPPKSKLPWIIGAVAVVLILAAVAAVVLL
ncbi:MAG: hypothetical protein QOK02_5555 [Mycobacterium sp.]|nr:hypothetical protein [Mycobacterium sp.]